MKAVERAGQFAATAGLVWLLLWFHQSQTHGLTQVNEKKLFLGATWMDSGKFYVLVFLLLSGSVVYLFGGRSKPSLFAKGIFGLVIAVLAFVALGTAIEFWPFPWGSYRVTFEQRAASSARAGGIVQSLGSLVLGLCLVPFGIGLARERIIPWWIVPIVVIAAVTGFFLTPANFIPGVGWLLVGIVLWLRRG